MHMQSLWLEHVKEAYGPVNLLTTGEHLFASAVEGSLSRLGISSVSRVLPRSVLGQ